MTPDDLSAPDSPEELTSTFPARVEPCAEWRKSAIQTRQFYVSLTQSGFSADEALELVKVVIRTAAEHGLRDGNE